MRAHPGYGGRGRRVPAGAHAGVATVAGIWIVAALAAAVLVVRRLDGALPVFTFVLLLVPLASLVRHGDAARVGIRRVGLGVLARTTAIAAVAVAALTVAVEPWSGAFGALVEEALATDPVDTTFGWLARYDGPGAWAGFVLYSGLVTIFAEELFFRGWLLQLVGRHTGALRAIVAQAVLFSLLQLLPALLLSSLEAVVYVTVYSFVAIGLVGGWAAWRTASIWPSLLVATAFNALLTALVT
jgi:membrane protease YdiL (CAAX protease family)